MTDPANFKKKVDDLADKLGSNVNKTLKKAALAIDQTIVLATPVDTGRARSNWLVSLDSPRTETIETLGSSPSAALAAGQKVINSFTPKNQAIYITNNLPYIGRLNEGYSAQAPAAFVEQSINAAVQAVKGAKLL